MISDTDARRLLAMPEFIRFLGDLIEAGGVFDASATEARVMYLEGRRSLALDMLRRLESAQPVSKTDRFPAVTSIQVLSEALQSAVKETKLDRSDDSDRDDD